MASPDTCPDSVDNGEPATKLAVADAFVANGKPRTGWIVSHADVIEIAPIPVSESES